MGDRRNVILLGPQRFEPSVENAVRSGGRPGPIASVTAGWQEREGEDEELAEHIGREVVDLRLYSRYDDALARDPELSAAVAARQQSLQRLQRYYRVRLDHALAAVRELHARSETGPELDRHRRGAVRVLRTLDRNHLRRLRTIHSEWRARFRPLERPAVARHREEIERIVSRSGAVTIAGGNVAILVNRMRMFALDELLRRTAVIAWSAGAMAITEGIVLFHDSPPQGAGNPEVFDAGLGLCRGVVALPDARRRLRLDDAGRVSLFARRFLPDRAVALDAGARLDWDGDSWSPHPGTHILARSGRVVPMEAS